MLDGKRLAGRHVDLVNGKRVLAAREDGFAVDLDCRGRAIDGIDKAAVRVHVNRAGDLPPTDGAGLGQGLLAKDRRCRKPAIGNSEHV